jgi:hypothetical protein
MPSSPQGCPAPIACTPRSPTPRWAASSMSEPPRKPGAIIWPAGTARRWCSRSHAHGAAEPSTSPT